MDTQALKEKIRQLEGLTDEERTDLLALLNHQKKYGLVWEEKPEEVEERLRTQLPVLEEVKERALLSDDPTAPNHILIEGDNLEALVALTYTHEGKVDVIYIDPPYNTGNKDFTYNDCYVDAEDGYRHSKWLSFMSKRLKIAKQLLSDRGVIFISIDDNEQAQLKLLCDEVFGNDNCLANLVWDLGTGTSAGHFTRSHEYILVYCKTKTNIPNFSGGEGIIDDRALKKESTKNHEFEYLFKAGTKFEAVDGFELTGEWGGTERIRLIEGKFLCKAQKLKEDVVLSACWTQKNQMDSFFAGHETFDSKGQKVIEFYFRDNGKLYCRKQRDKINPPSVLRNIATTKQGSGLLNELFGNSVFNFPKPMQLLSFLLSLRPNDSIILDFFAGSGTTLHATMQLNKEDGGHRQCILVTNNENKICEEVTYVRNKRAIQGYVTPKGDYVEGLKANTLRYYRTKLLSRTETNQNRHALMEACTELLCIQQDLYKEQPCFAGRKLNPRKARYFAQGKRRMLVIYDEQTVDTFAELLREMEVEEKIRIYLFSFNGYPYTDNFMEVLDKVELCALPQAIYNVYKRVLPQAADPAKEKEEKA